MKFGEAYGVCVILFTFITTFMVSFVALVVWHLNILLVLCIFLIFATFDGLYLSSALTKVPNGAWFTLALAVYLASIFILWRYGKENQWRAEADDRVPLSHLLLFDQGKQAGDAQIQTQGVSAAAAFSSDLKLSNALGGGAVSQLKGIGIFFDKAGLPNSAPAVFVHFLQKFHAVTRVVVFFHMRALSVPFVDPVGRVTVSRCSTPTAATTFAAKGSSSSSSEKGQCGESDDDAEEKFFFRVVVRHGYMDDIMGNDLGLLVYQSLRAFVIREGGSAGNAFSPSNLESDADNNNSSSDDNHAPYSPTHIHFAGRMQPHNSLAADRAQARKNNALATLSAAYAEQVVHIVGKEQMRVRDSNVKYGLRVGGGVARRVALAAFMWLRSNTGSRVADMNLEVEKVVEVGFVKVV